MRVRLKHRISRPALPSPPRAGRKSIEEQLLLIKQGIYYYRDGDVVLYRRPGIQVWQCRFRLLDGTWQRQTTGHRNRVDAAHTACHKYDEARFRQRHGLAPERKRFQDVAALVLTELRKDLAAGTGKKVYRDYCQAIERYLLPYFGNRHIDSIKPQHIVEFERWRNEKLGRAPAQSTLLTYASAWQRCVETARTQGWLTEKQVVAKLNVQGRKGVARPGFSAEEVERLRVALAAWSTAGTERHQKEHEMRVLLRDYAELLMLTGMRHGTEAMGLEWRHCEWYCDASGTRFLRIRVSGKTGTAASWARRWRNLDCCRHPACSLVLETPGYCDQHRAVAARDYGRARRSFDVEVGFYGPTRWRTVRAAFLRQYPACVACEGHGH